ncbi:hypothetical protein B0186_11155, partial [Canicola haemoglobinophilus]
SSYPNARGVFNLGEFLSQDNAYGKAAMGAIAQSGWATGVGKTVRVHLDNKGKSSTELGNSTTRGGNANTETKSDVANLGKNNPKFNKVLNENINHKPELIKSNRTQQRVNEIAHQFNTKSVEPKDMKLTINGRLYLTNPKTSIGSPVYKGVSDQDVITYFKELTGVDKLPNPSIVSKMKDLNGQDGKVWTIKPTDGPLKGSSINLRNFSSSQEKTNSKYTIEIIQAKDNKTWQSGIKSRNIEIKFEN